MSDKIDYLKHFALEVDPIEALTKINELVDAVNELESRQYIIGVDLASKSDFGCRVQAERNPDGTYTLKDVDYFKAPPDTCSKCGGSGRLNPIIGEEPLGPCPACHGTGSINESWSEGNSGGQISMACTRCGGDGYTSESTLEDGRCPVCTDSGKDEVGRPCYACPDDDEKKPGAVTIDPCCFICKSIQRGEKPAGLGPAWKVWICDARYGKPVVSEYDSACDKFKLKKELL